MKPKDRIFSWVEILLAAWKHRGFVFALRTFINVLNLRLFSGSEGKSANIFGYKFNFTTSESAVHALMESFGACVYHFKEVTDSPTIVDIGANVGDSVVYFKDRFPNSHIVAFEPNPAAFELLKKNVDENKFTNVELLPFGLGTENKSVDFFDDGAGDHLVGSTDESFVKSFGGRGEIVKSVVNIRKGSEVTELTKLASIDLLKLDIEGSELVALQGLGNILDKVRVAILEYHTGIAHNSFDELYSLLVGFGFSVRISGSYRYAETGSPNNGIFYVHATK